MKKLVREKTLSPPILGNLLTGSPKPRVYGRVDTRLHWLENLVTASNRTGPPKVTYLENNLAAIASWSSPRGFAAAAASLRLADGRRYEAKELSCVINNLRRLHIAIANLRGLPHIRGKRFQAPQVFLIENN